MARGWESKGVEAQQADASTEVTIGPPVSRHEADRRAQIATLVLARRRAEADLQAATADAHRAMLERAIADLDQRIDDLG